MHAASTLPPPTGRRAGVTLLELLLVIAVMAIVLTISMPAFTSMGRGAGMRGTVAEVKSTISLARQWAITKRERVTFEYGKDATATNASYYTVYLADDHTIIQPTNYLQRGFSFANANNSFTFKSSGDVEGYSPNNAIPITINGLAVAPRSILINTLTGGISVE